MGDNVIHMGTALKAECYRVRTKIGQPEKTQHVPRVSTLCPQQGFYRLKKMD
jgi:hypothetical protein